MDHICGHTWFIEQFVLFEVLKVSVLIHCNCTENTEKRETYCIPRMKVSDMGFVNHDIPLSSQSRDKMDQLSSIATHYLWLLHTTGQTKYYFSRIIFERNAAFTWPCPDWRNLREQWAHLGVRMDGHQEQSGLKSDRGAVEVEPCLLPFAGGRVRQIPGEE